MAAPNRWAVREAAEATFYDLESKLPRVTLRTLKMTEVQTTGETVYAMGGRGNAKLVGFSGNREATMALQDAIFDNEALAMLTGNAVTTGERTLQKFHEATLGADLTINLPFTPNVTALQVHPVIAGALEEALVLTTGYTATGKVVTVVAGAEAGDKVRVYYETTIGSAKTITVTASDFGGTFRLVADVLVRDAETSKVYYAQFIAPKAKIEDDFTFSFSPDGDPSVLDIPLQLLKDSASDNMWELVIYDEEV